MMPPKKALAARIKNADESEKESTDAAADKGAEAEKVSEVDEKIIDEPIKNVDESEKASTDAAAADAVADESAETKKDTEIEKDVDSDEKLLGAKEFVPQVIDGKRSRENNTGDSHLRDWLKKHFDESDETKIKLHDVAEEYYDQCAWDNVPACSHFHKFEKLVNDLFPKGVAVKGDSEYHGVIKPKKIRVAKVADGTPKLSDIVCEVLGELNSPEKCISYRQLKAKLIEKHPERHLQIKDHKLLTCLGISSKKIELVKGAGRCGYYSLPGHVEKKEKQKKTKKSSNDENKENVKEDSAEDKDKSDSNDKSEDKDDTAEDNDDDENKENEKNDDNAEDKKKEDDKSDKKKSNKRKSSSSGGAVKNKKKKKPANKIRYRKVVIHSDPQRIEDCFAMALTFMGEPKEASVLKIKKYIEEHYDPSNLDGRMKKALESGLDKGYWEKISSGAQTYQLTVDEFDPNWDETLLGQILVAIVACTEPKQCSFGLIKRYVTEYHPEFKVVERPTKLKQAVERGIKKNIIRQITGIGCSGTFQLVNPFTPSPAIIQGQDTADDYTDDKSDSSAAEEEDEEEEGYALDPKKFLDAYVPRPSKRRGFARSSAVRGPSYGLASEFLQSPTQKDTARSFSSAVSKKRKAPAKKSSSTKKGKRKAK